MDKRDGLMDITMMSACSSPEYAIHVQPVSQIIQSSSLALVLDWAIEMISK